MEFMTLSAPSLSPDTGTARRLSPLVLRVLAPNPSPFTYEGTQTYLVGDSDLAVIDPGPDDPAHLDALVGAIAGRAVIAILCTHTHRDHSPAARPLARRTGAQVIGCAPLTLEDDGPRADAAFDPDYAPDRVLTEGEQIAGTGWTLTALATPGHTSNHLCYALEEEEALFTGDHVMGWSTSVVSPPDGDMTDYLLSLERLVGRPDRIYYPAHGEPIQQPQRFARGMLGHRRMREGQILRIIERQGAALIPDFVTSMYVGLDPRLHGAAGRSVLAHLIDLERRGLVRNQAEGAWSRA
ncbi:MAG: MBL fold metallo-hydrolase [Alphaproteobacteria bacterium]|nr:MBL fold metallo-hydrolase [Alphaproteobacteria bacterium]MBU0793429.1 MBL fold metallo-hydrolase [Alphaproteobacteria bacterium]MBU0876980.1 MBL fold metallo-hydrolase [Alphaproteobacteria bacterium]MBU1768406.1 MBL fold metallo-hydrolase [Alphaproteobacteria bacterium]